MRILLSNFAGGPETLELCEIPAPTAQIGQVLVRVMAVALNFPDTLIIRDQYQYKPERPFAPGAELAGIVEAVGPDVSGLAVGDRVFSMPGWGGLSEQVVLDAEKCFRLPDGVPFEHGAALIMTYGTAYHALVQRSGLRAGETVLVTGAAGGVGIAAIQIAKALGARVVASASSQDKLDIALQHGADDVVLSPRGAAVKSSSEAFKQACPGGADVVVDCVGGDITEAALRAIAWGGRLLVIGFPGGISKLATNLLLLKGAAAVGVFYGRFTELEADCDRANMAELLTLYRKGAIRPLVSRRFPLELAGQAIAALGDEGGAGKIIVDIAPPESPNPS